MKISSLDRSIRDVFKDFLFVPRFQRPYSWEKEQVEQFWSDTITENPSDYFIGSVVLFKQGAEFGLVDGQQRITTALMLLCALRDAFDAHHLPDLASAIQSIVERQDEDAKKRFLLRTETSAPYFQDHVLQRGAPALKRGPSEEEKLLEETYKLLNEKVAEAIDAWEKPAGTGSKAARVLRTIRDRLLALKLIRIELDNEDDAYLVFETLNTRGVDLQASHLVKNHLSRLMKAKNKDLDALKEKWGKLLESFHASQVELDVDDYLHHYWLSKSKEYVTSKTLFTSVRKATTEHNAKSTLNALVDDAVLYRQMAEPSFGRWKPEDDAIRGSLRAISSVIGMRQPYPLLLSVLRCYRDGLLSKKNVESVLRSVECFHFAVTAIAQKSSSGGVSRMYASWAQKLSNAKTPDERQTVVKDIKARLKQRMPKKDDFLAGFTQLAYSDEFTKQKKLVRYVLEGIEKHLSTSGVAINFEKMTIEHVASQRPGVGAAHVPPKHVAMIGNLILCNRETQELLDNKSFAKKKPILSDSGIAAAKAVVAKADWTAHEIHARTVALGAMAFDKIWCL